MKPSGGNQSKTRIKEKGSDVAMTNAQNSILGKLRIRDPGVQVRWDHDLKAPAFLSGRLAEPVHGSNRLMADAVMEYLDDNRALFRMSNPKEEIRAVKQVSDEAGNSCVALQQYYKGLPVEGGTLRVQFDVEKSISSVSNKFLPDLDIDVKPGITADQAVKKALADAKNGKLMAGDAPQLVIYRYKGRTCLAWRLQIDDFENLRDLKYYIDARDGRIIHRFNTLMTGAGTGVYSGNGALASIPDGTIFKLVDNSRVAGGGPAINTCDLDGLTVSPAVGNISQDGNDNWNNLTTSPRKDNQGAEVDLHRYMGQIVDYYRTSNSWNSFDGAGATIYAGAHYKTEYNNAFYRPSDQKFYFGDGDDSIFDYLTANDVLAHEFTHGVTAHTSMLGYPDDQPGALNEAFSDIFAAFVDVDDTDMGEDITTPAIPGDCLRRMNNPSDPALGADFRIPNHCVAALDTMGIGYQDTVYDSYGYIIAGDPHVNCGPVIYAAYFMMLGGTHPNSGIAVEAIGYTKTSRIFWHVQSVGLLGNPNATFIECRQAALNAVNSLYKTDPNYLRIMDSVKNAYTAVGIGPDIYLRDSLSDSGTVPSVGTLCLSPDIITRTAKVTDPAVTLGDMGNDSLSEDVEHGQTNYVYLRLQNRGAVQGDVKVTLYWSSPATFGAPAMWHEIGEKTVYNVQPGTVSIAEFEWQAADLPPVGHFCLVGELDDPLDPAPDKTLITDGSMYSRFIAESNNFAWRNINVVEVLPDGLTGMEFTIYGTTGEISDLVLELDKLPAGTEVHFQMLRRLCEGTQMLDMAFDKANTRYSYYLPTAGKNCSVRRIPFQQNDSSTAKIYLKVPDKSQVSYEVAVAQYVNGQVVGRVTRIFNVVDEKDMDFIGNRNSMEVHKKGCHWIGKMSPKNKVGFRTLGFARMEGYDNCAQCLGDSKR